MQSQCRSVANLNHGETPTATAEKATTSRRPLQIDSAGGSFVYGTHCTGMGDTAAYTHHNIPALGRNNETGQAWYDGNHSPAICDRLCNQYAMVRLLRMAVRHMRTDLHTLLASAMQSTPLV